MTPERWAQVKAVVADALERPEPERGGFLSSACAGDTELRREVESLLAAASSADDSLPGARRAIASATRAAATDHDSQQQTALEHAVSGHYEILKLLGRGGWGSVYLARERSLDRFVALKVLRPEIASSESHGEQLRREASVVAQLMHPGIVPLHAFAESGGVRYFVMGYARGASLAERLESQGPVPWVEAHRMLMELTDAVAYAHKHRIVHRDIKPSNILLADESGRTMLADWGIAKALQGESSRTGPGPLVGTPGYISHEQVLGREADERSDVYSLGAVAYTMLAGHAPFTGATPTELFRQMLHADPPPIKSIVPSVPREFGEVVMRCLARNPDERWQSARELKDALVRAAASASEALPEPVRDLPSFGAYAILWAVAWSAFAMMDRHEPAERALLLLIAFLVPLGLALHVWTVGRHDLDPTQLARVAAWPPEWWGMWWPRSLRRPTDLWTRLPMAARVVRIALSAVFLIVPVLIIVRPWLQSFVGDWRVNWRWFLIAEGAVVALAAMVVAVALAWSQRQGLTVGEAVRLLFGATVMSSSWRSPRLARLLRPATSAEADPRLER